MENIKAAMPAGEAVCGGKSFCLSDNGSKGRRTGSGTERMKPRMDTNGHE